MTVSICEQCLSLIFSGSAAIIAGFSVNAAAIQSVINDLSDGRSIRIDVHPITCPKVTQDTLSGNGQRSAAQLGVAACLYMVNSLKPLIQRQMPVKSHFS
jgi:hypothetical protein